ncbi:hypothetical protein FBPa10_0086 [Pseudomonas phage vB_PaeM_FBPa10]|nr:hypothetical protein FBPa10_0086 [Pseudomonas phage vB_PaeM_FBPa10]
MIKQDLYKQIAFAAIGSDIKMFVKLYCNDTTLEVIGVEEAHIDGTTRLRYTGYADGVGFNFFADEIDVVMV